MKKFFMYALGFIAFILSIGVMMVGAIVVGLGLIGGPSTGNFWLLFLVPVGLIMLGVGASLARLALDID